MYFVLFGGLPINLLCLDSMSRWVVDVSKCIRSGGARFGVWGTGPGRGIRGESLSSVQFFSTRTRV